MLANLSESRIFTNAATGDAKPGKTGSRRRASISHDREFQLLVASALWPPDAADKERVRSIAQLDLDWKVFEEMVSLHRLVPIVLHNLIEYAPDLMPAETRLRLEREAGIKGLSVFHNLAEIFRLIGLFAEASIELRILKGIPLAILVYGDAGLRDPGDIDLLISEKDIVAADIVLTNSGYVRTEPMVDLTPRRFAYYVDHWKDFVYRHSTRGHSVELHWRLTRNRDMPGEALARPESLSFITAGAGQIPTLKFDDLFLYLCVHGALDGWLRLKSLADVGSLCRKMDSGQLDRLALRAKDLGILAELTAAILLAHRVFYLTTHSAELLPESHPTVRRILRFSWHAISANDYRLPREDISGREWARYELGLRKSVAYRWQVWQRILFRPRVWSRFPLPDSLFLLYPLLSPIEWLLYHGSHIGQHREPEL